jgi:hypothetical protein
MKNQTKVALHITVLMIFSSSCSTFKTLEYSKKQQEKSNLCWAAVSQIIAEKMGVEIKQCEFTSSKTNLDCCNADASNTRCNEPSNIEPALKKIGIIGCYYKNPSPESLSFESIISLIDNKEILPIYINNSYISGHIVVIVGYNLKKKQLKYFDPFTGKEKDIDYSQLINGEKVFYLGYNFKKINNVPTP